MKKLFFTSLLSLGMFLPSGANAQLEQGNVLIDVYYGFPNLYTTAFKTTYANSGQEVDLRVGGIGPMGGRIEYLLSDKIGFGIDVGYNNSTIQYTEVSTDPITGQPTTQYDYNFSTKKLGVIATFNYHFVQNEQLDAYAVIGGGYGNRSFKFESTDPNYQTEEISGIIPISGKIGVGMRYFFTDNIGANFAVGLGQGGVVNIGLSAKF